MNFRDKSKCYQLLQPRPILNSKLPTFYNVVQQYYYSLDTNKHDCAVTKNASSIIQVWNSANIPIICLKNIVNKIKRLIIKTATCKRTQNNDRYSLYFEKFRKEQIFDAFRYLFNVQ